LSPATNSRERRTIEPAPFAKAIGLPGLAQKAAGATVLRALALMVSHDCQSLQIYLPACLFDGEALTVVGKYHWPMYR
jgi:hypothetical protein